MRVVFYYSIHQRRGSDPCDVFVFVAGVPSLKFVEKATADPSTPVAAATSARDDKVFVIRN
jgi:hypothetical protein